MPINWLNSQKSTTHRRAALWCVAESRRLGGLGMRISVHTDPSHWAHCISRLNDWLPEYGKQFAKLAALDGLCIHDDPNASAMREVLAAELEVIKSRMHQSMGGWGCFEHTIEQEARKAVALATAVAARSEAKAAAWGVPNT